MEFSQSNFGLNSSDPLLIKEFDQNSKEFSIMDAEKCNLRKLLGLYCPIILGVSMFISLNGLLHTSEVSMIFDPDFIGVAETVNTGFLFVALVFLSKFISHRKEYIVLYSFTESEKTELRISSVSLIIMYFIRIGLQLASVVLSSTKYIDDFCIPYIIELDDYLCIGARYSIFIFSISLASDVVGTILSIIAVFSINKFTEKPVDPNVFISCTKEVESHRHNYLYCIFPIIFSCISVYFISLLLVLITRIEYWYFTIYLSTSILEIGNLISLTIANVCACKFVSEGKKLLSSHTPNNIRRKFLISYIFQFILSIIILGITICILCFNVLVQIMDYIVLSFTLVISGIYFIITIVGIHFSKTSYNFKPHQIPSTNEVTMNYIYDSN